MLTKTINKRTLLDVLNVNNKNYSFVSLRKIESILDRDLRSYPFSIRLLMESVGRSYVTGKITEERFLNVINNLKDLDTTSSIPYFPSRVVVQDYTGVPLLVDLAAMREEALKHNKQPNEVNPVIQTDVVIDHSIHVDLAGNPDALTYNMNHEYERNEERYSLIKWAEKNFTNINVYPPGSGIIHQLNLETIATLVRIDNQYNNLLHPDSVIGTDSHTTMINSLGLLGWGVGGIEAGAAMLGYPLTITVPSIVGVQLTGKLPPGVNTTDLVLTITEKLREYGVIGSIVEFYGDGLSSLSLTERATISNMAPEFGAMCAYFPISSETIQYLEETNRDAELITLVEKYYEQQSMLYTKEHLPVYQESLVIDLTTVKTCLAGPRRPQDKVYLDELKENFYKELQVSPDNTTNSISSPYMIRDGSILIAAITSCTNTSNPSVMIAAGLMAKKAYERGLRVPSYVKTSFSPGSQIVSDYLGDAGLMYYLEKLGFHVTGYGCMTCSGSGGTLKPEIEEFLKVGNVATASILSGNRNFESRIHPLVKANYLASPPLVIAYALTGKIDINLHDEPIQLDKNGQEVFLSDLWPSDIEVKEIMSKYLHKGLYKNRYDKELLNIRWDSIPYEKNDLYYWDDDSTYIKKPPFLEVENQQHRTRKKHRVLALLGDSITTDHISPGGRVNDNTPAAQYLLDNNVPKHKFNSYGSRRGNHELIQRATFGNVQLKNYITPDQLGGYTRFIPDQSVIPIFTASEKYKELDIPLVVMAGEHYGSGSSRDSAAKGTFLLGVTTVIAKSFERIHCNNLINMGILPLKFDQGQGWQELELDGTEEIQLVIPSKLSITDRIEVIAMHEHLETKNFFVTSMIKTEEELMSFCDGGVLKHLFKKMLKDHE